MAVPCSPESYRRILEQAGQLGYSFVSFADFFANEAARQQSILLRHDVDYSLELARELANINASCGAMGTFFVQLRSPVYNLLEERNLVCLQEIVRNGQKLAVHFRYPPSGCSADELQASVGRELQIYQEETGFQFESVVAWHNPTADLVGADSPFAGVELLSAYAPPFFVDGHYFSDSNLRNMPEDFLRILGEKRGTFLQILFHPFYWIVGGKSLTPILRATMEQVITETERGFLENPMWPGR